MKTPSLIIKREDILKFIDNSLLEKYYVPIDNIFPGKRLKKIVYKCLKTWKNWNRCYNKISSKV